MKEYPEVARRFFAAVQAAHLASYAQAMAAWDHGDVETLARWARESDTGLLALMLAARDLERGVLPRR